MLKICLKLSRFNACNVHSAQGEPKTQDMHGNSAHPMLGSMPEAHGSMPEVPRVQHTLSSSLTACVLSLSCPSPALPVAAPVSLAAAAAAALEAGAASGGEDMGGGKRMPAGRAPTLPLITVRFTVPWLRILPTRRPEHRGQTVGLDMPQWEHGTYSTQYGGTAWQGRTDTYIYRYVQYGRDTRSTHTDAYSMEAE